MTHDSATKIIPKPLSNTNLISILLMGMNTKQQFLIPKLETNQKQIAYLAVVRRSCDGDQREILRRWSERERERESDGGGWLVVRRSDGCESVMVRKSDGCDQIVRVWWWGNLMVVNDLCIITYAFCFHVITFLVVTTCETHFIVKK